MNLPRTNILGTNEGPLELNIETRFKPLKIYMSTLLIVVLKPPPNVNGGKIVDVVEAPTLDVPNGGN